jgi:hypothetical protein
MASLVGNSPPPPQEPKWYSTTLQSAGPNPTQIQVDYQIKAMGGGRDGFELGESASPVWLNVNRADLGPNDKVRAVWIDNVGKSYGTAPTVYQQDLQYAGNGRFTVELPDVSLAELPRGGPDGRLFEPNNPTLALVIDGDWLTDPVSQSHNFTPQMAKSAQDAGLPG